MWDCYHRSSRAPSVLIRRKSVKAISNISKNLDDSTIKSLVSILCQKAFTNLQHVFEHGFVRVQGTVKAQLKVLGNIDVESTGRKICKLAFCPFLISQSVEAPPISLVLHHASLCIPLHHTSLCISLHLESLSWNTSPAS